MDYLDQQDSILMSWFLYPLNLGVLVLFGPLVLLYNKKDIERIQREHREKEEEIQESQ